MLDFSLSEEQKAIVKVAKEFAEKEMRPDCMEYDESEKHPAEFVEKAWKAGLINSYVPEEYDGQGMDFLTASIVSEQLSWGCAGMATILSANNLGLTPVIVGGSEEQMQKYLTFICEAPRLAGFCLTEPGAGSDVASGKSTAVKEGDNYILNGTKCFISNGGIAELYTVFAFTDISKGTKGLSCFIVTGDNPGVSGGNKEKKMGMRASTTSEVIFSDAKIPAENLIGAEGQGFKLAMQTLDKARVNVGATSIGISQAAFEEAVTYSKERIQFGKPIAEQQAVQFMLADMAIEIEAGRLMYQKAAWQGTIGERFSLQAAAAKTFCSDVAMRATVNAVQVFGGYGYMRDQLVEKLMRDAKINQIWDGTNEIQRMVMARIILS